MIISNPRNSSIEMQLNTYNLNLSSDIKAEFRRAKSSREVRICLSKGAKSIAKQMCRMYGMRIVKPVGEIIKTGLQREGMATAAAETAEVVTEVTEGATAGGEGVTLSAEATELLTPIVEGGEIAATGSGFNPAVIVIVILVIAVAYYLLHGQVQTSNQRFLLNEEFRKMHKAFISKLKNA